MRNFIGAFAGIVRFQFALTRSSVENLVPVLTLPLATLTSLGVFMANGRPDLAPYGVVAATLTTIGQMGFFIGSELVVADRNEGILETLSIVPTPYALILFARVVVLAVFGCVGFVESALLAWLVFGVAVDLGHWPAIVALLVATAVATATTCLITAPLFALGRSVRTLQNGIAGPLYLLSGVLVPATLLPGILEAPSKVLYLSWAAEGLRGALGAASATGLAASLAVIVALSVVSGLCGYFLTASLMSRLQRRGTFA